MCPGAGYLYAPAKTLILYRSQAAYLWENPVTICHRFKKISYALMAKTYIIRNLRKRVLFGGQTRSISAKSPETNSEINLKHIFSDAQNSTRLNISNLSNFRLQNLRHISFSDYSVLAFLRYKIHSLQAQRRSDRSGICYR